MTDFYIDNLNASDFNALRKMVGTIDYPWFYGKNPLVASFEYVALGAVYNRRGLGTLINAIRLSETKELIGCVVLLPDSKDVGSAEIGYFIRPDYEGRRIVSKAARQVVKKAIDSHWLKSLHATVHPDKVASLKILRSLGLKVVSTQEKSKYMERDGKTPAKRFCLRAELWDIENALNSPKSVSKKPYSANGLNI